MTDRPFEFGAHSLKRKKTIYIPSELIGEILSFLDVNDLSRARMVCRDWNQQVLSTLTCYNVETFPRIAVVLQTLRSGLVDSETHGNTSTDMLFERISAYTDSMKQATWNIMAKMYMDCLNGNILNFWLEFFNSVIRRDINFESHHLSLLKKIQCIDVSCETNSPKFFSSNSDEDDLITCLSKYPSYLDVVLDFHFNSVDLPTKRINMGFIFSGFGERYDWCSYVLNESDASAVQVMRYFDNEQHRTVRVVDPTVADEIKKTELASIFQCSDIGNSSITKWKNFLFSIYTLNIHTKDRSDYAETHLALGSFARMLLINMKSCDGCQNEYQPFILAPNLRK